jgi:hypothetical protein
MVFIHHIPVSTVTVQAHRLQTGRHIGLVLPTVGVVANYFLILSFSVCTKDHYEACMRWVCVVFNMVFATEETLS